MHGLRGNCALMWAPKKEGVRWPLQILFPRLALGTLENVGVA